MQGDHLDLLLRHSVHAMPTIWKSPGVEKAWRQWSNRILVRFFFRVLRVLRVELLFDIGAYDGTTSQTFVEGAPGRQAIAVDANPANLGTIMRNVGSSVTVISRALGRSNGKTSLWLPPEGEQLYSLRHASTKRRQDRSDWRAVEVPVETLESLYGSYGNQRTFALWLDVEGATQDVICGGIDCIRESCSVIFVELESRQDWLDGAKVEEVVDLLSDLGFVPIARDYEFRHQFNAVFVRRTIASTIDFELQKFGADSRVGPAQIFYWFTAGLVRGSVTRRPDSRSG